MHSPHKRQIGAALISAIFITAIAAILATAIAVEQRYLIHNTELILTSDQAYLDLQGMQDWAVQLITNYEIKAKQKRLQAKDIPFNKKFGPKKFKQAVLTGIIKDQQGLFNLNNLVLPTNQLRFVILLQAVDLDLSKQQALDLARAVTAWITKNSVDNYYLNLKPPYRAAHQQLVNINALSAIRGFTTKLVLALKPYVTALPLLGNSMIPVNINTAPAPVLMTLSPTITPVKAKAIVACRKQRGYFQNLSAFDAACLKPLGLPNLTKVGTDSRYFLLRSQATMDHQQVFLTTFIVTQQQKDNKIGVQIAWQSMG